MKTTPGVIVILAVALQSMAGDPIADRLNAMNGTEPIMIGAVVTPGGELPSFSDSMIAFAGYAREHPREVRAFLASNDMPKEIAISLGLIPEKWAIDALIQVIPTNAVQFRPAPSPSWEWTARLTNFTDATTLLYYSSIHSLTYATGQSYGRTRSGTYFTPNVRSQWVAWWQANRDAFVFDDVQRTTACARYDGLRRTDAIGSDLERNRQRTRASTVPDSRVTPAADAPGVPRLPGR